MSEMTPSVLSVLEQMDADYKKTQASGGGFEQVGWPPAGRTYPAVVKNITIIGETTVYAGRDREKIKCPAIRFSYEILPDTSDPTVNPDDAQDYAFDGAILNLIPPSEITDALADTTKGIGFVFARERGRLKGLLESIVDDTSAPLAQQIARAQELINGDAAVGLNLYIDAYQAKDAATGKPKGDPQLSEYGRGALNVEDFNGD